MWLDPATPSLQLFLKLIIKSQSPQGSIGKCIVKAAKPRTAIPLILLGVRINLDVFGSKLLVKELFRLGFSISFDKVVQHKQTVVPSETVEYMVSQSYQRLLSLSILQMSHTLTLHYFNRSSKKVNN